MKRPELDAFDAQILTLLQRDNRMTAYAISEKIGLSPAACQKRLKRMRASGIIEAEVAILSPYAVGIGLLVVAQVRVVRDKPQELDRFREAMLDAPEVTQCYYVTGESNFIIFVAVPDMQAYERFSRTHCIENPDVSHFTSNIVVDRVKMHGILQISPAPTA